MKDPYCELQNNKIDDAAVTTFEAKGGNQGGNRQKKVVTEDNLLVNNNLQQSVKWIGRVEGGNRLGISKIAILKHIKQGHFVTRKVKMNGGFGYEISVESMFKYYESIGGWGKCNKIIQLMRPEIEDEDVKKKDNYGYLDDEAYAKYQLCKIADEIIKMAKSRRLAIEKFVNSFNKGAYPELLKVLGKISLRSVYRWYGMIKKNWDISVFEKEKSSSIRCISNREAEILVPMLLNPNRPLISETLKLAKDEFLKRGIKPKSDVTYRRFIEEWRSKNVDLWTLGRYGMKAFNDRIMKDILRDKDRIEVGDIVVADGHTLNVMVINPLAGRPQRMILIMFYDFKSNMPLGWEIMPTENTQTIASALRRTILLLGRFFNDDNRDIYGYVPKVAYLDNGRAFRSKYFNGIKDFKDTLLPGLFSKLQIEVMYATPYHGQSKTIERWFKTLGEMERRLPSYTGTGIAGKPAMMLRNEKLHKRLFDNTAITIESLAVTLEEFIKEYAEQPHQQGQYKGLTPAEVFMHSVNKIKQDRKYHDRLIKRSELNYLMLSESERVIGKNGIRYRGNYYWCEEMPRLIGSKVTIKYDIWDDRDIIVLDGKGKYLFGANKDDNLIHPAARLLGTVEDIKLLTDALEQKQKIKRRATEDFKAIVGFGKEMIEEEKVINHREHREHREKKKRNIVDYAKACGYDIDGMFALREKFNIDT